MRKRPYFPLAILLLFIIPTLPSPLYGEDGPPYGGTLTLSTLAVPATLNPILAADTVATHLGDMIFSSLVRFNEKSEPVPHLAESWATAADGRVWTFYLKKGVWFHDGVELTAQDAAFTYNTIIDSEVESLYAALYRAVESFEAMGKYAFRIMLKEPYAPLLFLMNREIVPAHLFKGVGISHLEFGKRPVGTGPFRLLNWGVDEIELEAFDNYFEGRPFLDKVNIRFFPDRLSSWSALTQGKVDAVVDLDFKDFRVIRDDPRFRVYDYMDGFYYTILFNLNDPLFSSNALREAIDLSVDRTDLIDKALQGWGVPATSPFRPGTWACNPSVSAQTFRPGEALSILEDLGWRDTDGDLILDRDGQDLTFTLLLDRGDSLKENAVKRIRR